MAWFGRRSKDEEGSADAALAGLTTTAFAQADVAIVAAEGEPGSEVLVDDQGRRFPLASLYELTEGLDEAEIAPAIDGWVATVLAAEAATTTVPADQLDDRIRTRLVADGVAADAHPRWAFGPGVSIVLMVDHDTAVRKLTDEELAGADIEALFARGQQHVDAEPITQRVEVRPGVTLLAGDSLFTATRALDMAHLVRTELGGEAPYGVVFGIPNRHQIVLHTVRDADVVTAVGEVARVTQALASDDAPGGPLSPLAWFWRAGGRAVPVSRTTDDGRIAIVPDEALARAIQEVTGA